MRRIASIAIILALLISSAAAVLGSINSAVAETQNPYVAGTFVDNQGREIVAITVAGRPPDIKAAVANVPVPNTQMGTDSLSNVPAFDWSYGCSATSAAMLFGYYDQTVYSNMYTGSANSGVCPLDNSVWGSGECPLSATHQGIDLRSSKGHVDDYWISYGSTSQDPYIGHWTEHIQGDCTGDFMGTNQSKFSNSDGATTFYFYTDGSPLYDYTGSEPSGRDGCHGLRLFAESRGYSVITNFSQLIQGYPGTVGGQGFTFANYMAEIDAGRPVLIQVQGHTMLGYGYDTTGNTVYLHDTWDHLNHSMTWGGSYSGMQHYAVTVIRLAGAIPPSASLGEAVDNTDLAWTTGGSANWFAQTGTYYYDNDAAQSGAITHSQQSYIQTTVTGPGTLTFYWKVSSEANYDFLRFYIDSTEQSGHISGTVAWQQKSFNIASGTHTLKWAYTKDASVNSGSDCGWLDKVVFTSAPPPQSPAIGYSPSSFTFSATQGGANPPSQTLSLWNSGGGTLGWSVSGGGAAWLTLSPTSGSSTGETDTVAVAVNVSGMSAGSYSATITISASGATNTPRTVLVSLTITSLPPSVSLGEAVDNTDLTWTTGGNANWFGETTTYYYGNDAAQSGAITHNQQSYIQTTVTGPGTLTFYWKVSSEANYDFLRFYIDSAEQSGHISGGVAWQQKSFNIASGTHTLKWAYTKDRSVNSGSDCGWLDKVEFTSASSSPHPMWATAQIENSHVPQSTILEAYVPDVANSFFATAKWLQPYQTPA